MAKLAADLASPAWKASAANLLVQGGCDLEEFQCGSGHCVEKAVRCDGNFDCMDKSDEEQCITTVIPVSYRITDKLLTCKLP